MDSTPTNKPPRRWKFGAMDALVLAIGGLSLWGWYAIENKEHIAPMLAWFGGAAYAVTLAMVYFRLKNQEAQIEIQMKQFQAQAKKEVNDRFHSAVALLGNSETSARTGAIYSLYHLAVESEKYRSQVAEILCAHIRSKTREEQYRKEHAGQPSDEIQTAINLLFRGDHGLYHQFFDQLPAADLSMAYLVNVMFGSARLQGVGFINAVCQGTNFSNARCQGAVFYKAHCQGAIFAAAQCQGATFAESKCDGANFSEAFCQAAIFSNASFFGTFALSADEMLFIYDRFGKGTEIKTMVVSGKVDEESIKVLKALDKVIPSPLYVEIMKKVEESERKTLSFGQPDGIIPGVLSEDDPDIQDMYEKYKSSHGWNSTPPA